MGGLKKDRLVEVAKEQLVTWKLVRRWRALLVGYRNPGRVTHSYGGGILGLTRIGDNKLGAVLLL